MDPMLFFFFHLQFLNEAGAREAIPLANIPEDEVI